MVSLIFTILAFICSFIPVFGFPLTILFVIISSVLLAIGIRKENINKEQKEVAIISFVIILISIIICIIVNVLSINKIVTIVDNIINKELDYSSYYKQKFNNYKSYSKDEEVNIGDKLLIKISDYTNDGDDYYINLNVKSTDEDVYYSTYQFILYDEENDNIYYPKYYGGTSNYLSGVLNRGNIEESTLKYEIENSQITKLYLIYIDDENGVKIAL